MNSYQELWWKQAESDYKTFEMVRRNGAAQCHSLHYLQMATEKLAKAYFWRSGNPPPFSHAGFSKFLRFLCHIKGGERERVAVLFSFRSFVGFRTFISFTAIPIAYSLERLAPDLAKDGPNPEYPWPHAAPTNTPVDHNFDVWNTLNTAKGRDLMRVVGIAVKRFSEYADT